MNLPLSILGIAGSLRNLNDEMAKPLIRQFLQNGGLDAAARALSNT